MFDRETNEPIQTIQCQKRSVENSDSLVWEATSCNLPDVEHLFYRYKFELKQNNGVSEEDGNNCNTIEEDSFRSFEPRNNVIIRDMFIYPQSYLKDADITSGFAYNFSSLLNASSIEGSLNGHLCDLEHMWHDIEKVLSPHGFKFIHDWVEKRLCQNPCFEQTSHGFFILIIIYGNILPRIEQNTAVAEHLNEHDWRKMRNKIATFSRRKLTRLAIQHIKKTGITVLRKLHQLHWLTVVAYFGNLYDMEELIEMKKSITEDRINVETVQTSVIPRILDNFGRDSNVTTNLLLEIPTGYGFEESEKDQLSQIVEININQEFEYEPFVLIADDTKLPKVGTQNSIYKINRYLFGRKQ